MKMPGLKNRARLRRSRFAAHHAYLCRTQHHSHVAAERGTFSVREVKVGLIWRQLVFAECLNLLFRNLPQHFLLAAKDQRGGTRDAGTKRHGLCLPMLVVGKLWPWSHQAHIAEEHIYQLRQLIQLIAPKKASHCGYAAIAMPRDRKPLRLRLGFHSAELVNGEQLAQTPYPLLPEDHGPGRAESHSHGKDAEQG